LLASGPVKVNDVPVPDGPLSRGTTLHVSVAVGSQMTETSPPEQLAPEQVLEGLQSASPHRFEVKQELEVIVRAGAEYVIVVILGVLRRIPESAQVLSAASPAPSA
jgi:hypothetical protein